MLEITDEPGRVVLAGELPATPEELFGHFVEPDLLATWWPDLATVEPFVGGSYRLEWPGPGWVLRGRYTEFTRPDRLGFTWKWDHEEPTRQVDIVFEAAGASSTRITIGHAHEGADERDSYVEGWTFFIDRLAAEVA